MFFLCRKDREIHEGADHDGKYIHCDLTEEELAEKYQNDPIVRERLCMICKFIYPSVRERENHMKIDHPNEYVKKQKLPCGCCKYRNYAN